MMADYLILDYDRLKSKFVNEKKASIDHNVTEMKVILPFATRDNPDFVNGFDGVVGGTIRKLLGLTETDIKIDYEKLGEIIEFDDDSKKELIKLIKRYDLTLSGNSRVYNTEFIKFLMGREENNFKKKSEIKIAEYLGDVLYSSTTDYDSLLKDTNRDVLSSLLKSIYPKLEEGNRKRDYLGILPFIGELFNDDLTFISKQKPFFLQNCESLIKYYYFFYVTQIILKLRDFFNSDYTKATEVYYTLDWERTNTERNSNKNGWKRIRKYCGETWQNIACLEMINVVKGMSLKLTYPDFRREFNEEQLEALRGDILLWSKEYLNYSGIAEENVDTKKGEIFEDAVRYLYECIIYNYRNTSSLQGATNRYIKWLDAIGKQGFLKFRGNLGYMLNLTKEFILFMTAVCVKDEKILLRDLFAEFEKRGIFLDKYSKEELVSLYDRLNILEKKSDSGDAQYVKSIL
jgi:DNA phosphorothioation-dependent restriction protein DptG